MKIIDYYNTKAVKEPCILMLVSDIDPEKTFVTIELNTPDFIKPTIAGSLDPEKKDELLSTSDLLKELSDAEILKLTIEHLKQKLNAL